MQIIHPRFGRLALFGGKAAGGDAAPPAAARLREEARLDLPALFQRLHGGPAGLTRRRAAEVRAEVGPNEVAHEKPSPWYVQLLTAFRHPFNLLLLTLAVVSSFTGDSKATIVISGMVLLSVLLRFVQEYRSGKAAERLQAMVRTTATVSRPDPRTAVPADLVQQFGVAFRPNDPTLEEVPIQSLVPGDVIHLCAGDMVPADVRVLTAKDLFLSQSILTGESMPVEKADAPPPADREGDSPLDLPNVCFMGSNVLSGTARAVVLATGGRTYFGALAKHLVGRRVPTSFDKGVNGVVWLLLRFMFVMVPLVFLINGLHQQNWTEAFLFALSMAVGLTPEMLPMIVTGNLARGAVAMSKRKVIVKRLNAIQNLGAIDVLCTDKTGTLTLDKVVLLKYLDVAGRKNEEVFEYAFLNSYFQTGLKNLLDVAVLEHAGTAAAQELAKRYIKSDEVPFDFQRRRMSVIVHEVFRGKDLLICKGAPEEILTACCAVELDGQTVPFDDARRAQALATRQEMSEDGLRVIAVAYKEVLSQPNKQYGVADECDLTLCGYVAFLDPPKESAAPAITALHAHGVEVKVLTGDNELVTRKVCRQVGLDVSHTLLGADVEKLSDAELGEAAERATVFAKLSPPQKARVIHALQRRGRTVGFLGDGINDAPALRAADVGVSVDTATDVARESADVILLEKSLLVLEAGVIEGRRTFGNTIKYIKMAASSNFGNMFSVLVASVWLPFLPMLPIQLLLQNLLYDISQTGIPFDDVDPDYLRRPRKWLVGDIGRFMLWVGPISSIFDLTTFALLWFVFGANTPDQQRLFQSAWFVEGLLSQTLIIHLIRTARVPFLQSRASAPLTALTLAVMAVGLYLPFSPLGDDLKMVPLSAAYFPWLAATLLSYCVLMQLVKGWYLRRFGTWL